MAHFGQNWKEVKWPRHFSSTFLTFHSSKININIHLKKSSLTLALVLASLRVKFPKSSFYTKMFSDPKYSFSLCQKSFFAVLKKDDIFHHSQPTHISEIDYDPQVSLFSEPHFSQNTSLKEDLFLFTDIIM